MSFTTSLLKRSEVFTKENSGTILTAVGVVGTVTTAVLTGRGSFKAAEILQKENNEIRLQSDGLNNIDDYHWRDKATIVWPCYIPAVGTGAVTVASIIMANRLSSKKAAALAAAFGLSEKAFQEYKEKVVEKLGENKERAVRDEIAQDRVRENPPVSTQVIITGSGDVLCFDMLTGRYFRSSVEKIRKAENTTNREIYHHEYASLSFFYDELGLSATQFSDEVGWNHDNICEVQFSTVMSEDDQPCVAINFAIGPVPNYAKFY